MTGKHRGEGTLGWKGEGTGRAWHCPFSSEERLHPPDPAAGGGTAGICWSCALGTAIWSPPGPVASPGTGIVLLELLKKWLQGTTGPKQSHCQRVLQGLGNNLHWGIQEPVQPLWQGPKCCSAFLRVLPPCWQEFFSRRKGWDNFLSLLLAPAASASG